MTWVLKLLNSVRPTSREMVPILAPYSTYTAVVPPTNGRKDIVNWYLGLLRATCLSRDDPCQLRRITPSTRPIFSRYSELSLVFLKLKQAECWKGHVLETQGRWPLTLKLKYNSEGKWKIFLMVTNLNRLSLKYVKEMQWFCCLPWESRY